MAITCWGVTTLNTLAQSIAIYGNLSEPSEKFPFGRVQDWDSVASHMESLGYGFTKNSLQAHWSQDARGRLLEAKSKVHIPNGINAASTLSTVVQALQGEQQNLRPPSEDGHATSGPVRKPVDLNKEYYKGMTKDCRYSALDILKHHLSALREAMMEEDGVETVSAEALKIGSSA
ncbi:hypothetical protein AAE478_004446 [Parahypoxylon ruwenzoriense]